MLSNPWNNTSTKSPPPVAITLRRLRQIRRRAGQELTTQLVLALVSSRLDYCNSVLSALPQSTVEPLQRACIQNAAARMIFNLSRTVHVTPWLLQLHWLPVQFRIAFKLCVMMHNIHVGKAPHYLSDIGLVQLTSTRLIYRQLRHTASEDQVRRTCFLVCWAASWNSLPSAELRRSVLRTSKKLIFLISLLSLMFSRFCYFYRCIGAYLYCIVLRRYVLVL